ncbi:hypothetical protein HERIO_1487 [Hepatospora eriocheir]|uniref:Uncharacterized protein n=1 Tax=Hepatospora eriocheir TaxID=1081669 RepID=A0A1X0QA75_9MICR|nr:hypothetical protein HERIO_1487 [Hepatospora eriocheir]
MKEDSKKEEKKFTSFQITEIIKVITLECFVLSTVYALVKTISEASTDIALPTPNLFSYLNLSTGLAILIFIGFGFYKELQNDEYDIENNKFLKYSEILLTIFLIFYPLSLFQYDRGIKDNVIKSYITGACLFGNILGANSNNKIIEIITPFVLCGLNIGFLYYLLGSNDILNLCIQGSTQLIVFILVTIIVKYIKKVNKNESNSIKHQKFLTVFNFTFASLLIASQMLTIGNFIVLVKNGVAILSFETLKALKQINIFSC